MNVSLIIFFSLLYFSFLFLLLLSRREERVERGELEVRRGGKRGGGVLCSIEARLGVGWGSASGFSDSLDLQRRQNKRYMPVRMNYLY